MKFLKFLAAALFALLPTTVDAAQATYSLPTTGPMSMSTFVSTYLNPALTAILSKNSGTTAPSVSGQPAAYQFWVDTSTTPRVLKMYDGANWLAIGTIDTSGHIFVSEASALALLGSTSGTVTIQPQATAGTPTLTLPNTSGTLADGASAPLALSATTGNLTCSTCLVSGGALGTPSSGTLTNASGLPTTGLTGTLQAAQFPALTGDVTTSAGSLATAIGSNKVGNSQLAQMAAGTIKSNLTGSTANASDNTPSAVLDSFGSSQGTILYRGASGWSALSPGTSGFVLSTGGTSANPSWIAATGTGTVTSVTCGTGLTGGTFTTSGTCAVSVSSFLQPATTNTISVGYTLTPFSIGTVSSGTTTLNGANGNYQYLTNNGAFTLAAPASDTAIDLLVTNGASAGAITFSGFTVGANTGDTLTTTNASKFIITVLRVNGTSTYTIKALQ